MTPYVLVVEDEDALATLLHYNLDKEGYQVGLAVLRSANNLRSDTIKVGQTLNIPTTALAAQP